MGAAYNAFNVLRRRKMQEKKIEIKLDKDTNPWKWVALILIGLMVLDLSCFAGGVAGGLVGFALGRKTARSSQFVYPDFDLPMIPEIPDYPLVPEESPFDMPMLPELSDRPRLGVTFVMQDDGAEIVAVTPGSPAEDAGIQVGDVITKVDGQRVSRVRPLNELILQYQPGDIISLTFMRDGRTRQVEMQLVAQPSG
jgi:membrane-associated protease RseP (regulator of RpoE activity)